MDYKKLASDIDFTKGTMRFDHWNGTSYPVTKDFGAWPREILKNKENLSYAAPHVYGDRAQYTPDGRLRVEDASVLIPNPETGEWETHGVDSFTYDANSKSVPEVQGLHLNVPTFSPEATQKVKDNIIKAWTDGIYMPEEQLLTRQQKGDWLRKAQEQAHFSKDYRGMTREQLEDYYRQNSAHDLSPARRAYLEQRIAELHAAEIARAGENKIREQQGKSALPSIYEEQPVMRIPVNQKLHEEEYYNILPGGSGDIEMSKQQPEKVQAQQAPAKEQKEMTKKSALQPMDILLASGIGGVAGLSAYGLSGFVPKIHENKWLRALIGAASGIGAGSGTAWLLGSDQKKEASQLKKADGTFAQPKVVITIPSASGGVDSDGNPYGNISGAYGYSMGDDGAVTEVISDTGITTKDPEPWKEKKKKNIKIKRTEKDGTESLNTDVSTEGDLNITNVTSLKDALKIIATTEAVQSLMGQSPEAIAHWRNKIIELREEQIENAAKQLRAKGKNIQAFGLKYKDNLLSSGMGLAAGSLGYIGSYAGLGMIPWFKRHKGIRFLASLLAGTGVGVGLGKATHKQLTRHYHPTAKATLTDLLGTAGAAATDAADAMHASKHDITYKDVEKVMEQLNS